MKRIQKLKLAKIYGLKGWSGGSYEEGLFDGFRLGEKKYFKGKKWFRKFEELWMASFDRDGNKNEFEYMELIKFIKNS